MKRLFSALGQVIRQGLMIGLISLISAAGLWSIVPQPVAASPSQQSAQEQTTKADEAPAVEQKESYEEIAKVAGDPKGVEKEYEKNREIDKKAIPGEGGLVEDAKRAVEKVTGKD